MCCCCLALPQPKARVLRVFQNSCWNSKQHKRNYVYELHSYCLKACGVCTASFSAQPRSNRRCTTYQPLRCYHGSFNRAEDLRDSDPTFNRRQHDQSAGPHDTCCHLLNFAYSAPHCSGYSCESSEPFLSFALSIVRNISSCLVKARLPSIRAFSQLHPSTGGTCHDLAGLRSKSRAALRSSHNVLNCIEFLPTATSKARAVRPA